MSVLKPGTNKRMVQQLTHNRKQLQKAQYLSGEWWMSGDEVLLLLESRIMMTHARVLGDIPSRTQAHGAR